MDEFRLDDLSAPAAQQDEQIDNDGFLLARGAALSVRRLSMASCDAMRCYLNSVQSQSGAESDVHCSSFLFLSTIKPLDCHFLL